ncbi:MAG: MATE family efflux transporter [Caldilineaceae bacterium SB0670_bin_27]|uniref:Probable multidrug resistance protein NorM n=1 Tax=Caldilineaceae bacterium SB0664_bin_27 TaxID=2605260 RepID=A0A6B0YSQ5_9CHLR|nr:MATE family efflux transporter [Caldilineaceae bacterium SB0664_bin_27]MYJ78567.1 MATE family efflux transporter [Caldilineaceae bacterium SB0670_bin_27]
MGSIGMSEPASGAVAAGPTASPRPTAQKRVFNLAWPVIGESFLETMLMVVDTWMVAQLSTAAIAGVGTSVQVLFFIIAALGALSVGSSVLVAQAYGAGKLVEAARLARQSIVWSVILSLPLALVGFFLEGPVIGLFGVEADVARIGKEYLQVTIATVVVLIVLMIGGGALRGLGDSQTPMRVTALANFVNVFLTYGLIFGVAGLPGLGAVGSAWGTFLSRLLAAILLLIVMWRGRQGVSISGRINNWLPEISVANSVLRIGVPAALEQLLTSAAFTSMTAIVASLGTAALASHRIAFNVLSLSFLPGFGFAIAATALVGQSVGAREPKEGAEAASIATRWAVVWMAVMGAVSYFLAEPILRLFSQDPAVVSDGVDAIRVVALAQPFWAILFVQSGALRGMGNTSFPLRANTGGIWATMIIAWVAVNYFDGGITRVWGVFLITSPVMAVILWKRFSRAVREWSDQVEGEPHQIGQTEAAVSQ